MIEIQQMKTSTRIEIFHIGHDNDNITDIQQHQY